MILNFSTTPPTKETKNTDSSIPQENKEHVSMNDITDDTIVDVRNMSHDDYRSYKKLCKDFRVEYFPSTLPIERTARDWDLYYYTTYSKEFLKDNEIHVQRGDCVYYIIGDIAHVKRGPFTLKDSNADIATVVRGYNPDSRTASIYQVSTTLPYVNGCSTKQIFPPERPGDPTLQLLRIPPYSAEQAHHIHSTTRVVYVYKGRGVSVVGMEQKTIRTLLVPGMICILDPMSPHHFETPFGEELVVVPLHIWSSPGSIEYNHPMFNGTHLMSQK